MARYIILPPRGLIADTPDSGDFLAQVIQSNVSTQPPLRRSFGDVLAASAPASFDPFERGGNQGDATRRLARDGSELQLIDALQENGAKLVELSAEDADLFARTATLARIMPNADYSYNPAPRLTPRSSPPNPGGASLGLTVACADTGTPLPGIKVTLLTDLANGVGTEGVTDAGGMVRLPIGAGPVTAELLLVAAPHSGHWGQCLRNRAIADGTVINLEQLSAASDPIAPLRAAPGDDVPGAGVRIAVIDSGIGPHGDIMPTMMVNTVTGQPAGEGVDNGIGHGTHVAGTIAARGTQFRGIAPGAEIFCYRVGASPGEPPTSYSIMKALDRASTAGCHIVNLSLSTVTDDVAVREAIREVNLRGCIVVAAAGNGWRDPIAEPARFDEAIAVGAFGNQALMPQGSDGDYYVAVPAAPGQPTEFVASFSNVADSGVGMGLIAPGVGIISLALGGGCRVMHGTSMATAIVSGQIARLISQRPDIIAMPPDHARSVAIRQLAFSKARRRGFGIMFEGFGAL